MGGLLTLFHALLEVSQYAEVAQGRASDNVLNLSGLLVLLLTAALCLGLAACGPAPEPEPDGDVWYRVQVGAFREKANADRLCAELQGKGYAAFVKAGA